MPSKNRNKGPQPEAIVSARNRRNSRNSPWRKMVISHRSAKCHEYFDDLAKAGDTRKIPRPELDDD